MLEEYCREHKSKIPTGADLIDAQARYLRQIFFVQNAFQKDPKEFIELIRSFKASGLLVAYGVPPDQFSQMDQAISLLIGKKNEIYAQSKKLEEEFLARPDVQKIPEIAKEALN